MYYLCNKYVYNIVLVPVPTSNHYYTHVLIKLVTW